MFYVINWQTLLWIEYIKYKMASPDVKWYYFDLQYGLALNINANVGNCFCKTYTYICYSITAILLHTEMP